MNKINAEKKKLLIRILVLALIAAGLLIIWVVKTHYSPTTIDMESATARDFQLESKSIDLDELRRYEVPIIIDFGADSCDPCKRMEPVLVKLNDEMRDKAIIKFVDVWKHPEAANKFPIEIIPTQIFVTNDGKPYVPSKNIDTEFIMYSNAETDRHTYTLHKGELTEKQMRKILFDMGVKK